jgi:hypothetical protein
VANITQDIKIVYKFTILSHVFSNHFDVLKVQIKHKDLDLRDVLLNHPSFWMFGSKAIATFKWPFATCVE